MPALPWPFSRMREYHSGRWRVTDNLMQGKGYCLAKPGEIYLVYLRDGGDAKLDLAEGAYAVMSFNPRVGGELQSGGVVTVHDGKGVTLSAPDNDEDWLIVVRKK